MIFISVTLQRDKFTKKSKDIWVLLNQRLNLWEAGELGTLTNDVTGSDKRINYISKRNDSDSEMVKLFTLLMMREKVRDAMNCLNENGRYTVLHPGTIISETGKT